MDYNIEGGFILIPAIELTKKSYFTRSNGEEACWNFKEYWGKGLGLLLFLYEDSGLMEYNSVIDPSTYQIINFEDGYKMEKSIK